MAKIPAHTLTQPKASGVPVPEGAFGATVRGLTDVMGATSGVVDDFIKVGREAQGILNDRMVRKEMRDMRKMQADFMQEIQTADANGQTPNPEDWAPMWQDRVEKYKGTIDAKGVPPVVSEAVLSHYEDFAGKSLLGISALAFKENKKRAADDYALDQAEFEMTGDFESMLIRNDEALANGTSDATTHRREQIRIKSLRQKHDINRDMLVDPGSVPKKIDQGAYGALPEDKQEYYKDRATTQETRLESKALRQVNEMAELDPSMSRKEYEGALMAHKDISDAGREAALKSWDNSAPLTYQEFDGIRTRISDDVDAFLAEEITFEEYSKRHWDTTKAVQEMGKRGGAGEFNEALFQYNPSRMKTKAGKADVSKEREAQLKEPISLAVTTIRDLVSGASAVDLVNKKFDPDTSTGKIKKIKHTTQRKQFDNILKALLEKEANKWIVQQKDPPDATAVTDYVNSIYAKSAKAARGVFDQKTRNKKAADAARKVEEQRRRIDAYKVTPAENVGTPWDRVGYQRTTGLTKEEQDMQDMGLLLNPLEEDDYSFSIE